jgi:hypothetical protein
MRIIASLLLGIAATTAPALAQDRYQQQVGGWNVNGGGGDCLAAFRAGSTMLMVVSPASGGENSGAIVLASGDWAVSDGEAVIELKGSGPWARKWHGDASADIHGYWLPFDAPAEADQFPDAWQLRAFAGTKAIADFPVSGFKAAVAKMRECVRATGKAG